MQPFKMRMNIEKKYLLKVIAFILEILAIALIVYLVFLPFYPEIKFKLLNQYPNSLPEAESVELAKREVSEFKNNFPASEYAVSPNRLIISKIGVNAPIVESQSAEYGLSKGAWHVPESSTPDKGGNTVITGHRFKYLPPNNMTFYLFDKLEAGDMIAVIWHEQEYYYRVKETKIVAKTEVSITSPTKETILTLFTCHPIYSEENRLVVTAVPIEPSKEEK